MFSDGTILLGTGDDDLREGSRVTVRIHLRDRPPVVFEAARGQRFPDHSDEVVPWSLSAEHRPPAPIDAIERVEVAFDPDRRESMWDDKWDLKKVVLTVDDTASGPTEVFRDDAVDRKFERAGTWRSGILPTYSTMGMTIVRVRDDAAALVEGAEVFVSGNLVGTTGVDGRLPVPSSSLGGSARIVVRSRVHEQDTYRSNHDVDSSQDWNYRVYQTNVTIDNRGVATAARGPFGSPVDITVRRDNTLIGVNLLVSVEWELAMSDLARLEGFLNDCSVVLYNATEGQFFVEAVQIADRRDLWDDSDVRVHVDWNYGANVPVRGAFLGRDLRGSAMKMSRDNRGVTYAHEFGHYGLSLGDEYRNGDGARCTDNAEDPASPFAKNGDRASCIMWSSTTAPKLCSTHRLNPHVRGTRQGDEACWDTLLGKYDTDPRWNLRSPVDRDAIPGTIRFSPEGGPLRDAFMLPTIHRRIRPNRPALIGERTLLVRDRGGAPVHRAMVKTRDPDDTWLVQGPTIEDGSVRLAGLRAGGLLRVEPPSGETSERPIPAGAPDPMIVVVST